MPGFNGRGPEGMGPMTGRGMGRCAPKTDVSTGRAYYGRGVGFRGRGCGRGFGFRWNDAAGNYNRAVYREQDTDEYVRSLETELDEVKREIESLKKEG